MTTGIGKELALKMEFPHIVQKKKTDLHPESCMCGAGWGWSYAPDEQVIL